MLQDPLTSFETQPTAARLNKGTLLLRQVPEQLNILQAVFVKASHVLKFLRSPNIQAGSRGSHAIIAMLSEDCDNCEVSGIDPGTAFPGEVGRKTRVKAIARTCASILILFGLAACQNSAPPPDANEETVSLRQGAADNLASAQESPGARIHALRIFFDWQRPDISAGMRRDLGMVAQQLEIHDDMRVELLASVHGQSYPQSRAEAESLRYALMVRQYLFEQGVPAARVQIRALGHSISGDQVAGKAQTGRVDVMLQARATADLAPVRFAWWQEAESNFLSDPGVYPNLGPVSFEHFKARALGHLPYKSDRSVRPSPGPSTALRG